METPPLAWRYLPGTQYVDKSTRLLEYLALGRQVRLIYATITRDQYDKALAYVVTDDLLVPRLWLNREILL